MYAMGQALWFAGFFGHFEHNRAEVERLASDLIELSTRQTLHFSCQSSWVGAQRFR